MRFLMTAAAAQLSLSLGASLVLPQLAGYPGQARADEVFFGSFATPAGCTTAAGDEGAVCPNNLTFNGGLSGTLTVQSFLGNPNTTASSFLTFKTAPQPLDEQGIGQNDLGPPAPCNTPDCEIGGGASVAVTAETLLSQVDVVISSVQDRESFNIWAGAAPGSLVEIASGVNSDNCSLFPGQTDVCVFNLASPATTIAVQSNNQLVEAADVLLAAVSNTAAPVPEPGSFGLMGFACIALAGTLGYRQRRGRK